MFFRRKNVDGFDWHKYVRTTIKLRRDQRRARLEDIGRVAAGQVKAAGDAAVHGVASAAGSSWRATAYTWRQTVARPAVAVPLGLCGSAALFSGVYRWFAVARDAEALLPLGLGLCLLALLAPLLMSVAPQGRLRFPVSLGGRVPATVLPVAATVALALALGWFAWGGAINGLGGVGTSQRANSTTEGAANILEGRPTVLSGEMIRLQGRLLHLSGIEAPDRQQTCVRSTKQPWRCGEMAVAALERVSRTKSFRCITQGGPDVLGRTEASCTVDGRDVAGELVKDGHVFSTASYFGGYAALETEARRAGNGLWSGDAERPADYRAKIWTTAKSKSPDGCPIKGRVSGKSKTYLMPWNSGYPEASMRTSRGDRWFCDEAEAQNAGFRLADLARRNPAK